MTNEEAVDYIICALNGGCYQVCNAKYRGECADEQVIAACNKAVEALKIQEEFRWHDFRNDPQDFPESNYTMVLAAMKEAYTGRIFYETFTVGFLKDFFCAQENNTQLIAWRLLEPFEVSE